MTGLQEMLFASMGANPDSKTEIPMNEKWESYVLNPDIKDIPIILIKRGPKNMAEVKKSIKIHNACIVIFEERHALILKFQKMIQEFPLDGESDYQKVSAVFRNTNFSAAKSGFTISKALKAVMRAIPNTTPDFDNRSLFSTHYLRRRLFDDSRADMSRLKDVHGLIGTPESILESLGWTANSYTYLEGKVSLTVTGQSEFSMRTTDDMAPSYTAVSKLAGSQWSILTNGTRWRLYTSRVSASSTNYFEIVLDPSNPTITKYLVAIFSLGAFEERSGRADIDIFFEEGKNYAVELEENLTKKIMSPDGLFLGMVKGILGHDMKTVYSQDELDRAKETALKVMYRIWFLAYAESKNLLPVTDERYRPISLQTIRGMIDSYEQDPRGEDCWDGLLRLFEGVRNGSPEHNLPQYNGNLFATLPSIDNMSVKNRFIAPALKDLLEQDGQAIDYSNLSVRHLGNILESIMEYVVRQADRDIMLLEEKGKVKEVKTVQKSTYSYKKNDLYLASKEGIARKSTASFYTPDAFVSFLVRRGLEPILEERSKLIADDVRRYEETKSEKDRDACIDRMLDIQVLDPTMGSGHFLVEALNRLTSWATETLAGHRDHPLMREIESDRDAILEEQTNLGITLDQNLLTPDVLLKRRIMKRCIFGVDLNPMATELAKLSLWLDSFAIGVPLTYMDHHIKTGDSTMGSFLDDMQDKENSTLDDWSPGSESDKMISTVVNNSDVTIGQVHESEDMHVQHTVSLDPTRRVLDAFTASKIDPTFLPKKSKTEFIHKFKNNPNKDTEEFAKARKAVNELSQRRRFFHWELEMMDAFTDARRGFDCIVGNPPWDKPKPNDDEFFTSYEPTFRDLSPKTKKNKIKETLLKNAEILSLYDEYKNGFEEKSMFYKTYSLQGAGDKELSKLVLESVLGLAAEGGTISMVMPSQILSSVGSGDLRKEILEKDIRQLYVFENRKKIFPIDSRYRFLLLTMRNRAGRDEFPAGFYLHHLESLNDMGKEKEKFGVMSKKNISKMSSAYVIPEILGGRMKILAKLSSNNPLGAGLEDGTQISLSSGFHKTNDAGLFRDDGNGWPVYEGKNFHQYNHMWDSPVFTVSPTRGLKRESTKRAYLKKHVEFYDSYRLVVRDVASSTNMRTVVATIIPPHTFHTYSLRSFILVKNDTINPDNNYSNNILYLCGVMNSLTFDFVTRANVQMHVSTIINSLPIPSVTPYKDEIITKTAKMLLGTPEFVGLAEQMHMENRPQTVKERIETAAKIDALVAMSYDLETDEYQTIIESFPAFKKNASLHEAEDITWNNSNLKEFYGEMADLAIKYFKELTGGKK